MHSSLILVFRLIGCVNILNQDCADENFKIERNRKNQNKKCHFYEKFSFLNQVIFLDFKLQVKMGKTFELAKKLGVVKTRYFNGILRDKGYF